MNEPVMLLTGREQSAPQASVLTPAATTLPLSAVPRSPDASLTPAERLAELERLVTAGLAVFVITGQALQQIHDERLYEPDFASFSDYVTQRFGFTQRRANQLIASVKPGRILLAHDPDAVRNTGFNQSHAEALAGLEPQQLVEVYESTRSSGTKVTARTLTATRRALFPTEQEKRAQEKKAEKEKQAQKKAELDALRQAVLDACRGPVKPVDDTDAAEVSDGRVEAALRLLDSMLGELHALHTLSEDLLGPDRAELIGKLREVSSAADSAAATLKCAGRPRS